MLSGLGAEPQVVIDDAEFRNFDALPLFGRIGAGDAFSRLWVLRVGAAIPFDDAAIESKGEAVYYNKALFQKAGITSEPKTYDELVAAADKLAKAGIPAFTFGGTVNWHVMRLMDEILEIACGAEKHDALMSMKVNWAEKSYATKALRSSTTGRQSIR